MFYSFSHNECKVYSPNILCNFNSGHDNEHFTA